jgi:hypothetical protein
MPQDQRKWLDRFHRWLWSPFVLLPPVLLVIALWPEPTPQPPIFVVQMHYNDETGRVFPTRSITEGLTRHNVVGALVSSIPNENTERLANADRNRLYPLITPYRTRDELFTWFEDPESVRYVEDAVRRGGYRGIGDFNLFEEQAHTPVVRRLLALAGERRLLLTSRSDAATIRELFAIEPRLHILWAPGATSASPGTVETMLHRYPTLWVNLSLSRYSIAPGGALDPAWRELFVHYPDRFMVGTDTYTSAAWYYFRYMLSDIRKWLAQLPPDVAERIAFRNALALVQAQRATAA